MPFKETHWIFSFLLQMHPSVVPGSPILSRQPLTPRQHYNQVLFLNKSNLFWYINSKYIPKEIRNSAYVWCYFVLNQTGGFMFPTNRPCPSTQSLPPKMMQHRFGANSPRPSPIYSPSSNSVQHFRCVTILCASQECSICGKYLSSIFMTWQLVHPSRVYKTHRPDVQPFF